MKYRLKKDWITNDGIVYKKNSYANKDKKIGNYFLSNNGYITFVGPLFIGNKDWFEPVDIEETRDEN